MLCVSVAVRRQSLRLGKDGKMRRAGLLFLLALSCYVCTALGQTVVVDATPGHVKNSFRPTEALGAAVDRIPLAATDKNFTQPV